MPRIEREIVINRPVDEVFDFMADGRNEPQYNPHMRWSWEVEPRGVFKLMTSLLARMMGRRLDTVLANLKRLLEAHERRI